MTIRGLDKGSVGEYDKVGWVESPLRTFRKGLDKDCIYKYNIRKKTEEGQQMGTQKAAIATKEQEGEALKRMKKIADKLGPDSYIGAALKGAWEIAERNIDLDLCESVAGLKDELWSAHKKISELEMERNYWERLCKNRK